jgi:hypothetical protein
VSASVEPDRPIRAAEDADEAERDELFRDRIAHLADPDVRTLAPHRVHRRPCLRHAFGLREHVGVPALGHLARGGVDRQPGVVAEQAAGATVDGVLVHSRRPLTRQIDGLTLRERRRREECPGQYADAGESSHAVHSTGARLEL